MSLHNIAIIAHVDHGKTTLIDTLFKQSGLFRENQAVTSRAMDKNDIERERGITILAKCTSIKWQDARINIIDTPGHVDFGGEVERILGMVDGVVLLVDASEGPMPQTKFVLSKALELGLCPIVVINKADKPEERCDEVLNEVFDLFINLNANDQQLDFPVLYASGRSGWAVHDLSTDEKKDLTVLMDTIIEYIPPPKVDENKPFSLLVTMMEYDPFLGRLLTGRVETGTIKPNTLVHSLRHNGEHVETCRISKILAFRGLEQVPVEEAVAGDIVSLAGLANTTVSFTIATPNVTKPLNAQPIDPPTLAMTFSINDSPLAGKDGDKVTSRQILSRLEREAEGNVALSIEVSQNKDAIIVSGRGELQLSVLIETMRREGFELSISRPRVLFKMIDGINHEPIETITIDTDDEYQGIIIEKMTLRKGEMTEMKPNNKGKTRLIFLAPSRGLIGYYGEFLTDTRGTGVMNRIFHSYSPHKGSIASTRRNGALISSETGTIVAYALWKLQERGVLFSHPGDVVYEGMIIGEHSRDNDLEVNPLRAKKITNIRAAGKDDAIILTNMRSMPLEIALSYIQDDELVEVTPLAIRLRKKYLISHERKKSQRHQSDT